jgi:putative peptide zinc metalloprotease protein
MPNRPHTARAVLLVAGLTLLLGLDACVRLRESTSGDPAAAGNISRAQVVTTASPETTPFEPTATQPSGVATAVSTPVETPSPATTPLVSVVVGPSPTAIPCKHEAFEDELDVENEELDVPDGGPQNAIKVCNRKDGRMRIRGRVQLNRIPGNSATPANLSLAWSSCRGCTSISVAMQINLISRTATTIAPRNEAFSFNYRCRGCVTVGLAYQFTHQVDNPKEVPENVRRLIQDLNAELRALHSDDALRQLHATNREAALQQAVGRIQAVIDRFFELSASLDQRRQEAREDDTPGAAPD